MRLRVVVAGLVLAAPLAAGCSSDKESYCEAVKEHQGRLGEIASEGGPSALLDALPIYRELQDDAPRDITDEWQQVIRSLDGLEQALDDAGVDVATYDPKKPPPDLDDEQVDAIADAADQVGSRETQQALQGLEQQALDVCQTPLSL